MKNPNQCTLLRKHCIGEESLLDKTCLHWLDKYKSSYCFCPQKTSFCTFFWKDFFSPIGIVIRRMIPPNYLHAKLVHLDVPGKKETAGKANVAIFILIHHESVESHTNSKFNLKYVSFQYLFKLSTSLLR